MEYYECLIDEIVSMIKNNILLLYRNDDNAFINMKKYCEDKNNEIYKSIDQLQLVWFVDEVLAELISQDWYYDFRDIE